MENKYPACHTQYCGCVGYAFVPVQNLCEVYSAACALNQGTIFPELDLSVDEYGKVCKKVGESPNE